MVRTYVRKCLKVSFVIYHFIWKYPYKIVEVFRRLRFEYIYVLPLVPSVLCYMCM